MQRRIIKNKFLKVALLGCLVLGSLSFAGSKDYKKSNFSHKKSSYKRSKITPARAKQIALAKVPGATLRNIKDFDFDEDFMKKKFIIEVTLMSLKSMRTLEELQIGT